jgi:hypothetical protein
VSGTLVVAIVGVALSTSALGSQIAQFVLSGSRVKAQIQVGAAGVGGALLGPPSPNFDWQQLIRQGYDQPVLAVTARNLGRTSVSVTGWRIIFDSGLQYFEPASDLNHDRPVPYTLAPGTEVTWLCPMEPLAAAEHAWNATQPEPAGAARARVLLGTGKVVTSEESVRIS